MDRPDRRSLIVPKIRQRLNQGQSTPALGYFASAIVYVVSNAKVKLFANHLRNESLEFGAL